MCAIAVNRRAFLCSLIGKPYKAGGVGPLEYDCYGLARHVLAGLYNISLPSDRFDRIERQRWQRVPHPIEGALVIMGSSNKHIGVYVSGGVLHALECVGVIHDDLSTLAVRGFGHLRVYRAHDQSDTRQARRL